MALEHAGEDQPPDRAAGRERSPTRSAGARPPSSPEYRALVPPPTWVTSGMPSSSHTDHSGSQTRRLYSGSSPSRIAGKFTPRSPASCAHSHLGDRRVDVPHREVREADVAMRCLRHEVGEPAVVDRHADADELTVADRLRPCRAPDGDERDRLHVHGAVEDHAGGDAVVVVVGEPSGRVVVAGGAEVRVVEVPAALEHRWPRPRRSVAVAAANRSNSSRCLRRAVRPEVLDEARADVGVVGDDDDRLVP